MTSIFKQPIRFWIALLCAASFLLSVAVSWYVFEAVPHLEDEHANLFQAKVFAAGRVVNPVPPDLGAFFTPFIITSGNIQFSKYPPGYSLLLALGVLIKQPWLVNSLASALTILAVFLLTKELFDERCALLAAALGVLSPMQIMLSGTFLSHPTCLAAMTFFAWAFLKARRLEKPANLRFALLAGLTGGLGLIIRPWTAVLLGLPFVLLAVVDMVKNPRKFFLVYLLLTILFLLISSLYPLYNLIATGSPFTNTYTLWWSYDTVGFGLSAGNHGYTLEKALLNLRADLPLLNTFMLGWPGNLYFSFMWLVILAALLFPQRTRIDFALLIPVAFLIIGYSLYWAHSGGLYGPRYYAEAMPYLWILSARGLEKLSSFRIPSWLIKIAFPLCILWSIIFNLIPSFIKGHHLYDISREDATIIQQADLHNAIVFVGNQYWTDYGRLSWLNEADLYTSDVVFVKDQGAALNNKVLQFFPGRKIYSFDWKQNPPLMLWQLSLSH